MAFLYHAGTFQSFSMPLGLTNAPVCFQRALDFIFIKYNCKIRPVYLDDVCTFSNTVDDHIKHIGEILTTLSHASVMLKINTCHFFRQQLEYLGHMVKPGCLDIDQTKVASLRNAIPPKNPAQLRSLLVLCNLYRPFIDEFSGIAHLLKTFPKKMSTRCCIA